MTRGDIYKSQPYRNYSTAETYPEQTDEETDEDSTLDFASQSDSDSTTDIEISDEETETPGTPDTDESTEGTPSPETLFETPEAPLKPPDHPSAAFRAVGGEYPEYTGTAFPPKLQRTKHFSPTQNPAIRKNLLRDLDEFVLGPRSGASAPPALGPRGKPPTTARGTRSAGPAPPIGNLPRVPIERKSKPPLRGKPDKK
jgi:hypothetical protein